MLRNLFGLAFAKNRSNNWPMPTLTVYIDEAGDPGAKDGLRFLGDRHEWLTFGAVIVRTSREAEVIDWTKDLQLKAQSRRVGALHYAQINLQRRRAVCDELAGKPCRAFVFVSHKSNLREYFNPRLRTMIPGSRVYNWCFRLLLERVTAWCAAWQKREVGCLEPLRIVLAERGHDYEHFNAYIDKLRWQRENGSLLLKGPGLDAPLLDRSSWTIKREAEVAGLQLADVVASAFYQGANTASPSFDAEPAKALWRIVEGRRSASGLGVNLWPLSRQAKIPEASRPLFEYYGYRF